VRAHRKLCCNKKSKTEVLNYLFNDQFVDLYLKEKGEHTTFEFKTWIIRKHERETLCWWNRVQWRKNIFVEKFFL